MIDRASLWALSFYSRLRNREEGQAAVEYGVLLAVILAVVIGLYATIGTEIKGSLQDIIDKL